MLKILQTQGFEFLYPTLGSLEKPARLRLWLLIHAGIYLPVLVYSGVAVVLGILHQFFLSSLLIVVFNLLMLAWPLLVYERKLLQPDVTFFTGHLQRWLNRRFTKPPVLYFIYELLTNYPAPHPGRKAGLRRAFMAYVLPGCNKPAGSTSGECCWALCSA